MQRWLQTLGWLACVVYSTIPAFWLMIHPFAQRWRERRRSPYRVLIPVWLAMWVVTAAVTEPRRQLAIYSTPWTWVPAAFLFAGGFYLYFQSRKNFTPKQLGGIPELHNVSREQRLVTEGIRAHVRHPVYLAHLCEMLAWSLGTGLAVCWGLTAFAMVTGAAMIRMEDVELEKRFGEVFRRYRSQVPAVLPRLVDTHRWPLPSLSVDDGFVEYKEDEKTRWRITIREIVCIAEYTTTEGPWLDDYYLAFATAKGLYYEASFYSNGRDTALDSLSTNLNAALELGLYGSAGSASRIIWPPRLEGRPLVIDKSINPEVKKLTEARQI